MPSPDITPYVDLTVYDVQPATAYDISVDYARAAVPGWTPLVGSIEDAILQAAAGVSGELLGAINRVPSSIFEALLQLFGVERLTGSAATGRVRMELLDRFVHTIPAGTRVGWRDTTTTDPLLYVLETVEDVTSVEGAGEVTVGVRGILNEQYPDLQAGTVLRMVSGVSFVNRVTLLQDLNPGTDVESDADYFTRATGLLRSYTSALVLPQQFESYVAATYNEVYRAKAFSRLNPDYDLIGESLPEDGRLTIYACGLNGASLGVETTAAIVDDLTERAVAGLVIEIVPPQIVPLTVDVVVTVQPSYAATMVVNSVTTALEQHLTPNYWSWGDAIYYNELVSLIDAVPGVARVDALAYGTVSTDDGGNLLATAPVDTLDLAFTHYGSLPDAEVRVTARPYTPIVPTTPAV
jgi:hypothetical protein